MNGKCPDCGNNLIDVILEDDTEFYCTHCGWESTLED